MKAKKLAPIPMESILNNRCDIRNELRVTVSEEDKDITPVIWEEN